VPAVDMVICADGGVHNARRLGVQPSVVIGDLDSLDPAERERLQRQGVPFDIHPVAKDETDLELALLWCVRKGAQRIIIAGASGGRPDHALANLLLLADVRLHDIDVCLLERDWEVRVARRSLAMTGHGGDTLSLIPLSAEVTGVWTEGLAYPLRGETLYLGPARGVSNEMVGDTAQVRFDQGLLVVMHGPPQHR
jgi:thiamine pyrophosphokinase